ncbi:MAG: hypothetical protein WDO71_25310 [Bacteroidota bacterium]
MPRIYVCHSPPAFSKKKLVEEQGYLDQSIHFSMDTDLYVRAGLHYPIIQVEDVLARFRLHGDSKSVSAFSKTFLDDNKKIFSRVLATLDDKKAIEEMKRLGLYDEPAYIYNKPAGPFDTKKMIFYFLAHRLLTLHFRGETKEFKRIFRHLLKYHTRMLLSSRKLLLYRVFIFFPPGFFHSLAKIRDKAES